MRAALIDSSPLVVSMPRNAIVYNDGTSFRAWIAKPPLTVKEQRQLSAADDGGGGGGGRRRRRAIASGGGGGGAESTMATAAGDARDKESNAETLRRLKAARARPTFELAAEELDRIYELQQQQRTTERCERRFDRGHFDAQPTEAQQRVPFATTLAPERRLLANQMLQVWFTRSDVDRLSIARAMRGYGFATVPGSAQGLRRRRPAAAARCFFLIAFAFSALIANSFYAIRDRADETDCLKVSNLQERNMRSEHQPNILSLCVCDRFCTENFPFVHTSSFNDEQNSYKKQSDVELRRILAEVTSVNVKCNVRAHLPNFVSVLRLNYSNIYTLLFCSS